MTNYLAKKKILIGITGGIAAYKVLDLIRRLRQEQAEVRTILTKNAEQFITPLSVHALSGEPVLTDAMQHIELARWADVFLVAPATANFVAKAAHGLADDLLSSTYLATDAPVLIAPAMNQQMWDHHGTQQNIEQIKSHSTTIIGPAIGSQACGEYGPGRMLEPSEILENLNQHFMPRILEGKRILITAGPTQEAIDPVRFISNHSTGKMGYALAQAAIKLGAEVTLIRGPTNLTPPREAKNISIITAEQMLNAVLDNIANQDMFISCAAVTDYRPNVTAEHKIKKSMAETTLVLEPTIDILSTVAQLPNKPFLIGFAAETQNLIANAITKMENKGLDMIVANSVANGQGFAQDYNAVTLIGKNQTPITIAQQSKISLAFDVLQKIAHILHKTSQNFLQDHLAHELA